MQEAEDCRTAPRYLPGGLKDTRGAAAYLKCSKSFLEKLRCFGGGPVFIRLGRAVRYRTSDLDDWVARQRHKNTAPGAMEVAG